MVRLVEYYALDTSLSLLCSLLYGNGVQKVHHILAGFSRN